VIVDLLAIVLDRFDLLWANREHGTALDNQNSAINNESTIKDQQINN
jgi:hypothetical protein